MLDRRTELVTAVQTGAADRAVRILGAAPELAAATDDSGLSLLLLALYQGQADLVAVMRSLRPSLTIWEAAALGDLGELDKQQEAHPEAVNQAAADGFTPLGLAVFFGHWAAAQELLTAGADPNRPAQNRMRVAPLHSAAAIREPQMGLEMARLLLGFGAKVNVAQQGGWTPLHQAADRGNLELIELLLARGADVLAQSEDGRTPLDMAQAKGFEACAARLQAAG